MSLFLKEVQVSIRRLAHRPAFTLVATLSLALGIGANALVFSLVNTILLKPLPYPDADRLVIVWFTPPNEPDQKFGTNAGAYFTIRDNSSSFERIGAGRLTQAFSVQPTEDAVTEWIPAQWFSPDLIRTLGVEPLLGQWPFPGEDFGMMISYGLWQRMFGGSPDILGTTFGVGGGRAPIAGVMPQGYHLMDPDTGIWVYQPDENMANALRSPNRIFTVVGRLKEGVTPAQAQLEMDRVAELVSDEFPETHLGWGLRVERLHDAYVGNLGRSLWVFQGAVFLVLLIACANVGALLLSQAAARERELAVRSALGSGRRRLISQLLTDNLLLSFLGAVIGIGLAWAGTRVVAASGMQGIPRLAEVSLDWRVAGFAAAIALATGILFGVLPALHVSRPNVMSLLREASWGSSQGLGHQRIRAAFVVAQVSMAVILLVASGLLVRSFVSVNSLDLGFDPDDLTVLEVPFPRTFYRGTGQNTSAGGLLVEFDSRFADQSEAIIDRLNRVPGVVSAAATTTPPLGPPARRVGVRLEGETLLPSEQSARTAEWYPVSPGFFATLDIPLIRGRVFGREDRLESRQVAVINTAMAERLWPEGNAIGQLLQTDVIDAPVREVIGVVGNVRQDRYQSAPQPQMYIPRLQVPRRMDMSVAQEFLQTSIVVRSDGDIEGMEAALRAGVGEVDRTQPVSDVRTVGDYASGQLQDLRRATFLLLAFGLIAVLLAMVGVFGVVAHVVSQRRGEIGIRMALGAQGRQVLSLVAHHAFVVVVIGLTLGTVVAFALTRVIRSLLYGVAPTDPVSFAAALVILLVVALAACSIPALRALRINPAVALRNN